MVLDRRGFEGRYKRILERLGEGNISRRRAAKALGIGYATLKRLLSSNGVAPPSEEELSGLAL